MAAEFSAKLLYGHNPDMYGRALDGTLANGSVVPNGTDGAGGHTSHGCKREDAVRAIIGRALQFLGVTRAPFTVGQGRFAAALSSKPPPIAAWVSCLLRPELNGVTMSNSDRSVSRFYEGWQTYYERIVEVVRDLSAEELAVRPAPDGWPIWATVGHTAGVRVYWLCGVFGEPGEEATPFPM